MKKTTTLLTLLILSLSVQAQTSPCPPQIPDITVCMGGGGIGQNPVVVNNNPNYVYEWRDENGNVIGTDYWISYYGNETASFDTNYYVTTTNPATSCVTIDTVTIHFLPPPPQVFVINDTTLCANQLQLTATASVGSSVIWNKSEPSGWIQVGTGLNYTALESGTYQAKATFPNNICENQDETIVTLNGQPLSYLHDTAVCQESDTINIPDNVNTNCTYLWDYGMTGGNYVLNQDIVGTFTHTVTITNTAGCETIDTITTTVHPKPAASFAGNISTCGELVLIEDLSSGNYNYHWFQGSTPLGNNDSLWTSQVGTYGVRVTSNYGCVDTYSIEVTQSPSVYTEGFNFIPDLPNHPHKFTFYALNVENGTDYHWDFGDGGTSNQENPTHVFNESIDSSLVALTVSNPDFTGNCASFTVSQMISTTSDQGSTGINELSEIGIRIYPNPTTDIIHVDGEVDKIELFDVMGRKLNKGIKSLDLSNLPSGNYIIKVFKGQDYFTKKITKL